MSRCTFVLLFSLAVIGLGIATPTVLDQCGPNEVFQSCGSACPPTCADPTPGACTRQCVTGCFCKSGHLKNKEGMCVPDYQCDTQPQQCGDNEEYRQCKGCDGTCEKPNPPCPRICVAGCACKQGHLRTGVNGECIPQEQCPAVQPQCPQNEVFHSCGSACYPTCANPNPGPACTLQCVAGCFCKPGFLKNSAGQCIAANQCDAEVCGDNEEYRQCKGCDGTCENPNPMCPRDCRPGCACKQGHLRSGVNGKCIPNEQCPTTEPKCPQNEVFLGCGSACYPTCEKPIPGPICTLQCIAGCFCKPGLVKNTKGVCVPANQCDVKVCGDNEEYRQCKGCDGTCDKPNPICPRICRPGCACKQGHLRTGANGKCIPQEQCKPQPPQCPQNEVFNPCGTACPATCANPNPSPACTKNCVIGCFCQEGYLRNDNGICVPTANC